MNRWVISFIGVWLALVTPAIAANTIFSDNFESGTLAAWSDCPAGAPNVINTVQSTVKHSGTYAMRIDLKRSVGNNYYPCLHEPNPGGSVASTRHYISFWVNWGSPATTNSTFGCYNHWWRFRFDNGRQLDYGQSFRPCRSYPSLKLVPEFTNLFILGSDRIGWHIDNIFWNTTNPDVPNPDGLWHRVEMLLYLNTPGVADGTVKVWHDGVINIDTDAGLNPSPFCNAGALQVCIDGGYQKRPRGSEDTLIHRLDFMTNADVAAPQADCADMVPPGKLPCNDQANEFLLFADDLEWLDNCPATGASCSGTLEIVQGKRSIIMSIAMLMFMLIGFASLLMQSSSLLKPKMVR